MSVTQDIARSYRAPGAVIRRQLAAGPREDRVLAYLMFACFLIFIAQWPRMSREAFIDPSTPFEARLGGALLGWMCIAPLAFYAIAAISNVVLRLFGARPGGFETRLALFWTLLAISPLWLLHGLVAGFIGPGPGLSLVGAIVLGGLVLMWAAALREILRGKAVESAAS